jgi:DUF971 family protein
MSVTPVEIKLRKASYLITVKFDDGSSFDLPFEYLRVFSPSADVKGHGSGQGALQIGKQNIQITSIESIGNYAVRLFFDDGHHTGLYTWNYLYELGVQQAENWQAYLDRLKSAGFARHNRVKN